jgi:hypothetical protein
MVKTQLSAIGNQVYSKIYKMKDQDVKCPRPGCKEPETPLHIFNNCAQALHQYGTRHNAVQDVLVSEIKKYCHGDSFSVDEAILRHQGKESDNRRPDISFAKLIQSNEVQIGEFKVPFVTNLEKVYVDAKTKYEAGTKKHKTSWIDSLKLDKPLEMVRSELATIVVGSLGVVHPQLAAEIQKYDIPKKDTDKIISRMVVAAIRGSHQVWYSRCRDKWVYRV